MIIEGMVEISASNEMLPSDRYAGVCAPDMQSSGIFMQPPG
jgi:hypothetical protein